MVESWVADLIRGSGALAVFGVVFLAARWRFKERGPGDATDNGLD